MVDLVGLHGGESFGPDAAQAIASADVLVGAPRHLGAVKPPAGVEMVELEGDLGVLLDRIDGWERDGRRVCVLVSGDPGFFGLGRLAGARLGREAVTMHPAPSSVSLAFARAGRHWDDAVVASAHGRDAGAAVEAVLHHPKVAVLCSPATPPEALGASLAGHGPPAREVTVAARLGEADEDVWRGDVGALAAGRFDPLSVVIFLAPPPEPGPAGLAWGRPETEFAHRRGMITKSEVRAVALGKLSLPAAGVMWDVGAGSGSVSAECVRLAPGLRIFAVEKRPEDAARLRSNVEGTAVRVVEGAAPEVLAGLPDPDRAFVGGGGLEVLDEVLRRLRPGGSVVATYASPGRAAEAAARLGGMAQISVSRAVPIGGDGSIRLAAENPVFVCWGPEPA